MQTQNNILNSHRLWTFMSSAIFYC